MDLGMGMLKKRKNICRSIVYKAYSKTLCHVWECVLYSGTQWLIASHLNDTCWILRDFHLTYNISFLVLKYMHIHTQKDIEADRCINIC